MLVGRLGRFSVIVLIFLCSLFRVILEVFSLLVKVVILVMIVDIFLFFVLVWLMVLEWLLCRFCSFWVCIWMCLWLVFSDFSVEIFSLKLCEVCRCLVRLVGCWWSRVGLSMVWERFVGLEGDYCLLCGFLLFCRFMICVS